MMSKSTSFYLLESYSIQHTVFKMLLTIIFLALCTTCTIDSSSYSMAMTDCNNTLHQHLLYENVCCCPCNAGKNFI